MRLLFLSLIFVFNLNCNAQIDNGFNNWKWLLGNWVGEGAGKPGDGIGRCSFYEDLDKRIVRRENYVDFPKNGIKPVKPHSDLMVIFPDSAGDVSKAIYFDNEGHIINYNIEYVRDTIIMTSEKIENSPFFRLTYKPTNDGKMSSTFEISSDGINFSMYIRGTSRKVKPARIF